jgi:flagellar capping protein FliD
MTPNESLWEAPPAARRVARRGSAARSLLDVNQRLAKAERELRIQFTRIAQLQAQLDSVMTTLRRSLDGAHVR